MSTQVEVKYSRIKEDLNRLMRLVLKEVEDGPFKVSLIESLIEVAKVIQEDQKSKEA